MGSVHPQVKLHTNVFVRGTLVNVVAEVELEGISKAMKKEPNRGLVRVTGGREA